MLNCELSRLLLSDDYIESVKRFCHHRLELQGLSGEGLQLLFDCNHGLLLDQSRNTRVSQGMPMVSHFSLECAAWITPTAPLPLKYFLVFFLVFF